MKGLSGMDMQTQAPKILIHQKLLPVRLVKHTLGNERALRIAVLLVLEVRFVLAGPYTVTKSDNNLFKITINNNLK